MNQPGHKEKRFGVDFGTQRNRGPAAIGAELMFKSPTPGGTGRIHVRTSTFNDFEYKFERLATVTRAMIERLSMRGEIFAAH